MAIIFEAWKPDGPDGQERIASLRSDAAGYSNLDTWLARQKTNPACVLITRSRTDNQSPISRTIWTRPGYVDPCR